MVDDVETLSYRAMEGYSVRKVVTDKEVSEHEDFRFNCHCSITCHMSHVTCHMSHVTCTRSHVICHVTR